MYIYIYISQVRARELEPRDCQRADAVSFPRPVTEFDEVHVGFRARSRRGVLGENEDGSSSNAGLVRLSPENRSTVSNLRQTVETRDRSPSFRERTANQGLHRLIFGIPIELTHGTLTLLVIYQFSIQRGLFSLEEANVPSKVLGSL